MSGGEMVDVLANWVWQGSAVALVATAILAASRLSATARYHLWWVALSVVLVLPVLPWALQGRGAGADLVGGVSVAGQAESPAPHATLGVVLPTFPAWAVAALAFAWFSWAMVSLSRTLVAVVALRRAKSAALPFPAERESRLETWLSLRTRGRRAALGVSDGVRAAAVLGLTSPAIVVAPSALAALDDEELDQIVVHEWAHVQRRDDFARLVQRVIEALAGWHPAVWWIDRQLNLERETACDDWAINATGSARGLAVCLTKLAAMPGRPADAVLLPAAFLTSELTTRVVRLLDRGRNTSTTRAFGSAMLVAPVLSLLALAVASVQLIVTSPVAAGERPGESVAQPVVAAAGPSAPDRAAIGPDPASGRPDPKARPADRPRRVASVETRTVAPSTPARNSSELEGSADRAPLIPSRDARQTALRLDALVPAVRTAFDETQGAELAGLRTVAVADMTPATSPGSGVSTGAPTGAPAGEAAGSAPTPWGAAADAGVTVGKGTQKAAVATAGFFTRLSKSITGVF